jgi:tetratricopeptide (TPR) repeat protein
MTESSDCCDEIVAYLDGVRDGERDFDHEHVSAMLAHCPSCVSRVAEYFQVLDVAESGYLNETIDDLTKALYDLVKALMKSEANRQRDLDEHENVLFVDAPGDAEEIAQEGDEMIDDVQDYVGSDQVRGESMESLRLLIDESKERFDATVVLLQRAVDLDGHFSLDCRNLLGILHLKHGDAVAAEACFREVIRRGGQDLRARTVQVHAMNNLSFICGDRGELDEAIQLARKSRVLADETGIDPFGSYFGLMYFHLRRDAAGDLDHAAEAVEVLVAQDETHDNLKRCLGLASNAAIRDLIRDRGLADRYPSLIA